MRLLLDTHLLLWAAGFSARLPDTAREMILDTRNNLYFSSASIWEISIKAAKNLAAFQVDSEQILLGLLANDYLEVPITSRHSIAAGILPAIHKDPFDRILIAQAFVEGFTLLTIDTQIMRYEGPILKV